MKDRKFKWDAKLYQDNSSFQYNLALMAIEKLQPQANEKILDIGCGNALATIELAKHVHRGEVVAVEISPEMYRQALDNIKENNVKNISVINMDAFEIDFQGGFDAVFSNSAIHWINDLESMYGKIYHALKNRGRIIIQTALKENNSMIDSTYKLPELPEYREYFKSIRLPWRFLTRNENIKILDMNNFKNIIVEPYVYEFSFTDTGRLKDFFKSAALIPFLSVLPEDKHEQLTDKFTELYFDTNKSASPKVRMSRVFISGEKR